VTAGAALLLAVMAFGATVYTIDTTTPANKAGTARKPARFVGGFSMTAAGKVPGERADSPSSFTYRWKGVRTNGADFPRCSPAQIDAAQSDSVCPKGSLIAVAPMTAALGVQDDPKSILACNGKTLRVYNNGPTAETWFLVGSPNDCNGIIYLAPFPGTVVTKGKTSTHTIEVPENVCHPLPGIECALTALHYRPEVQNLRIRTKDGRTVDYMTSSACGKQRRFTFIARDSETTTTLTANAGRC
jgi:hypothetical protein